MCRGAQGCSWISGMQAFLRRPYLLARVRAAPLLLHLEALHHRPAPSRAVMDGNHNSGFSLTVAIPGLHQVTTLLESVASPVGALGLVPDRMRQCRFNDLARMVGHVAGPITERR